MSPHSISNILLIMLTEFRFLIWLSILVDSPKTVASCFFSEL